MRRSITATLRAIRASSLATGGGATFFVALLALNGSNFAFHIFISRELGPTAYGALGAILSLLLVLSVPVSALQATVTKEVAARRGSLDRPLVHIVVAPLLADAVLLGIVCSAAMGAASPLLQSFLHLPSMSSAVLLAAYVLPVAIGLVPKAVLLGDLRYKTVSMAMLAGVLARLAVGVTAVRAGAGVNGAIAATVIGEVVTAGLLLPSLRHYVTSADDRPPIRLRVSDSLTAIVAFTGFLLLTGTDTILARHYLSGTASGLYAAASTAASSALFLPGAIALTAFPRFAAEPNDGPERRRLLFEALALVGAVSVGVAAVLIAAPRLVIRALFGDAFVGSTAVLGILAVSAVFLGLITVLLYYHLAAGRRGASSLCLIGVAAMAGGIVAVHSSMTAVALVALGSVGGVFLVMLRAALLPASDLGDAVRASNELWERSRPALDVTVVVPYYNPGPRLGANLSELTDVLDRAQCSFEVIAVSDGSTDGSALSVASVRPDVIRHVALDRNMGKGQALRVGLSMGRGRYLGFIDADGDIDPVLLADFLEIMKCHEPDLVLASKRHPDSQVHYPPIRRLYSWGYQQLVHVLFRLKVRDTQTGLKLVKREVLAHALPRMLEKRFAFDLELVVVADRLGHSRFLEAPVTIRHRFSSTISIKAVWGMLLDTIAIFYRLRLLHFYDQSPPVPPLASPVSPFRSVSG